MYRSGSKLWQVSPRALMIVSVLATVAFMLICASVLLDMRSNKEVLARQASENLAVTIDADLSRNLEIYDLSLRNVVNNMVELDTDRISAPMLNLILFDHAATAKYCDPTGTYPGGRNFWTDLTQRQLFKEAWIYLAGILKDMPNIAFYELLPEPLGGRDSSYGAEVSAFYQELMAAIEDGTGDKRTPFLVGARDAYNINLCDEAYIAAPRWANRVVYTGDLFIHTGKTQAQNITDLESRLGALVTMKNTRNVPVFIQQFGVRTGDDPDETILSGGLAMMDAAGVGYTGWQWRQNTTDPSQFAVVVADPVTGADVYKTAVLQAYSAGWKA